MTTPDTRTVFDRALVRRRRERVVLGGDGSDFLFAEVANRMADRLTDVKRGFGIGVDLGNFVDIDDKLKPLLTGDGAPDILVNGVGYSPKYAPSGERWTAWTMPLDHWREVLTVDLDSIFYTSALAIPKMIERGYGRIINIASMVSRTSGGGVAPVHYVTAKTALLGLTRATAQDAGRYGITVNAINPGRIDTPMIRDVPDKVNESIARSIPLKRLGTPQDVAGSALFLASRLADYLTGVVIEVNGGMYMA